MSEPVWVPLGGAVGGDVVWQAGWQAATAYRPGDVVEYGGINFLAVNPSTGQAPGAAGTGGIGTSLPASPTDGMEFTLIDSLTTPTYSWRFRYLAAKATNKWLFIGGAPARSYVPQADNTTSASFVDLANVGPSITVPVAGDYLFEFGFQANGSASITQMVATLKREGAAAANSEPAIAGVTGVSFAYTPSRKLWVAGANAGGVYKLQYSTTSGTATFRERYLTCLPIAVGG